MNFERFGRVVTPLILAAEVFVGLGCKKIPPKSKEFDHTHEVCLKTEKEVLEALKNISPEQSDCDVIQEVIGQLDRAKDKCEPVLAIKPSTPAQTTQQEEVRNALQEREKVRAGYVSMSDLFCSSLAPKSKDHQMPRGKPSQSPVPQERPSEKDKGRAKPDDKMRKPQNRPGKEVFL